jgi:uncharacterized membrane protein HdeD (DUF308 family)
MSAGLARNWWAVGLRGILTVPFGLSVLVLPSPTVASLVLLFSVYVAADGIFAILAGSIAARRGERWWTLMLEGATNLAVAGTVLVWPAIALVPFVELASGWAVATGALLLAAAHRLSGSHGRRLLALAGILSAGWGALATTVGPSSPSNPEAMGWWLLGYAVLFGGSLLALSSRLHRAQRESLAGP